MFADKFIRNCSSSNLKDDEHNHQTEALHASAWAERELVAKQIRSLMARVKYCDGPLADQIANNSPNLRELARKWLDIVTEKGKARNWIKIERLEDISVAHMVYRNVATFSLDYYLDGKCPECAGTGATKDRGALLKTCTSCKGTGRGSLPPMLAYENKLTRDMISELESLEADHAGCASKLMRRDV